jgi:hypothetical protein
LYGDFHIRVPAAPSFVSSGICYSAEGLRFGFRGFRAGLIPRRRLFRSSCRL